MPTSDEGALVPGDLEEFFSALAERYAIERELGRGGHAIVFQAIDLKHKRAVAIKVLRPELALHVRAERFLREIEIIAGLQHPHIVSLFDSGTAAGRVYYVMPYIEGETLESLLERSGPLALDEAIRYTREIAEALSHAHSRGVVHRDIKPGNILLSGGHALVADFGIARALRAAGGSSISTEGVVLGTPEYMSPEQAGATDHVDARSDQYSLACVLYAMLAGKPPFTGSSAQAVIARHLSEPPPSIRVVRPSVSLPTQEVLGRALAKVPADRWATVAEFAEHLEATRDASADDRGPQPNRKLRMAAVFSGVGLAAFIAWRIVIAAAVPLDPNFVIVFPLVETPAGAGREGVGEEAAIYLVNALQHTEPLKWEDGWRWLAPTQRQDLTTLSATDARNIAQVLGARWWVEGTLARRGDFLTIVLRLMDAKENALVGRADGAGPVVQAPQSVLRTIVKLLPHLLAPGREIDLTAVTDRHPSAIASWLQGEREYRRLNFEGALTYFERAVEQDSQLAVAALRGAQAASWINRIREATALATTAFQHRSLLPTREALFARGFAAYLNGAADSAVLWLERALADAPRWTEAHMMLGEVYYHLLPTSAGPLDSLAEVEFLAAATDTGFAPPRYHLAETAVRAGAVDRAERAVRDFARLNADARIAGRLERMLACARGERASIDWKTAAAVDAGDVTKTAKALAVGGALLACAEDGFRAVLATPTAVADHWGAVLGLHGVLAAQGRSTELVALIDSVAAAWAPAAPAARRLFFLDAAAGLPVDSSAAGTVRQYDLHPGAGLAKARPTTAWLVGTWQARQGAVATVQAIRDDLSARSREQNDATAARLATALSARIALLRGDSATAIRHLQSVLSVGRRDSLEWELAEPMAGERLLLAQLLLARGQAAAAITVASVFDHQGPIVFLPYLPASLTVRVRASESLGNTAAAARYRDRLRRLGLDDQPLAHAPHVQGDPQ
jgi:serine/threonine-protein kinase